MNCRWTVDCLRYWEASILHNLHAHTGSTSLGQDKSSVSLMHFPRHNRMQYRVSVGSLENVSRTDTKSQSTDSVIRRLSEELMQSLRSLWIILMTDQAASQPSPEGKICSKKTRSLASIPPTRAAHVNRAKRAVFPDGFVWPQTPPKRASVTMSFSGGWQPAGSVWVYLNGQLFRKKWTIPYVMKLSTAGVRQCVEDVVSLCKGNSACTCRQVCATEGSNCF